MVHLFIVEFLIALINFLKLEFIKLIGRINLMVLGVHISNEIKNTVRVTEFVIVPGN